MKNSLIIPLNTFPLSDLPLYLTITETPSEKLSQLISEWSPDKIAILVDEHTKAHCLPLINAPQASIIEISSGEKNKTLDTCQHIWNELTQLGFSRKSLLINLGGGVIGDMGGFCASTFKRGIRFINVPTTLLSQVDASIGGKLGIDFGKLKNHIGVFKEPDHVIVCPAFLKTLPERELRSGYAEIVKHALIYDEKQWNLLKNTPFEATNWQTIIPHSIAVKNAIVTEDPLESGLRKNLNFGHTLGHAIESKWLDTANHLLHGEAIAVGMILEAHLSFQLEWLSKSELDEIVALIKKVYTLPEELPGYEELKELLSQDKKNVSNEINFSLLDKIGGCKYDIKVSDEMIQNSFHFFEEIK